MKVKFMPMNIELDIESNESVLELAKRSGVFIKSICGGVPACAECRVKVLEGDHNIMPPTFKEKSLIGSAYFIDRSRLSCQIKCMGNITVDLTEQVEKQNAQPASKKPRMPLRKREPVKNRDAATIANVGQAAKAPEGSPAVAGPAVTSSKVPVAETNAVNSPSTPIDSKKQNS